MQDILMAKQNADEPISALDPIGLNEVMTLIRSLRGKTTVFLYTHILTDVENTCDHVLILEKGKVLANDTMMNLKQKHANNTAILITVLCVFLSIHLLKRQEI